MPIARELRHLYRTPSYRALQAALRARALGRCEWCKKPRGPGVSTRTGDQKIRERGKVRKVRRMFWKEAGSLTWYNEEGYRLTPDEYDLALSFPLRHITVRLCAAHLNHVAGDDRLENGALLCEWCHFYHDRPHHLANSRKTRQARKDAGRPLLAEAPLHIDSRVLA